jgi:hypothetical protein
MPHESDSERGRALAATPAALVPRTLGPIARHDPRTRVPVPDDPATGRPGTPPGA